MMTNLFNIFDPVVPFTYLFNWFTILTPLLIPLTLFFSKINYYFTIMNKLFNYIFKEYSPTLIKNINFTLLILSIFVLIMMNNLSSNLPYLFPTTSHLSMTTSLALTFWLMVFIFMTTKNLSTSLTHLTPMKTPYPLIPLMIIIESISLMIRPLTLALRLTINMIAGHLILSLVSEAFMAAPVYLNPLIASFLNPLMLLEVMVAFIQSYVFAILISLYIKEANS